MIAEKMDLKKLREDLRAYGQEHLLQGWTNLNEEDQRKLYAELSELDLERVTGYFKRCMTDVPKDVGKTDVPIDADLHPLPSQSMGRASQTDEATLEQYREAGKFTCNSIYSVVEYSNQEP